MRAIILMFDSLNRHMLPNYSDTFVKAPNFERLAGHAVTFDNFYAGSMPCIPARREMHTGRYNFLHRTWGPLEPFDDSMYQLLGDAGIHTHLVSDHPHYWEDGGATYHTRFTTWDAVRGQEGDPWKACVAEGVVNAAARPRAVLQDTVNRRCVRGASDHCQTRTVNGGLEFIASNQNADNWLLQIECFDPHEPFFSLEQYLAMYDCQADDPDWPLYERVKDGQDVDQMRRHYAALLTQCDHSLGRVLDAMDRQEMWDDTLLLVNTDHGFLLGEHGWWAKGGMPWYNELVHTPAFLWDPRSGARAERRNDLAQTIDIAPTLLRFFGVPPTMHMQGRDLADRDSERTAALFGTHGEHVNVTDGRYVYMRGAVNEANSPRTEYTLMPTHMRARFSPEELHNWRRSEPFAFAKGLSLMAVDQAPVATDPWATGTLLYDCATDPAQKHPIVEDDLELRMAQLLVDAMRANEAPASEFERIGLPRAGDVGRQHLRARQDRLRVRGTSADPAADDDRSPDGRRSE